MAGRATSAAGAGAMVMQVLLPSSADRRDQACKILPNDRAHSGTIIELSGLDGFQFTSRA